MDPISQAVVGATAAQTAAGNRHSQRLAFLAGVAGGLAPDLDVLIRSDTDPLLFLEFHRQFTHSLLFVPIGGLIVAAFLYLFCRRYISFGMLYLFATVGYATHGLLDSCTSYGTQLFWPFTDYRVAWDVISIIDPVFTLPILVLVLVAFFRGKACWARAAMIFGLFYLSIGWWQHGRAIEALGQLAAERGHVPVRAEAKPSFANLYVWKLIYEYRDRYYVDAVRLGTAAEIVEGESVARLDWSQLPVLSARQLEDVRRFSWFSDNFLVQHPADPLILGDMRYSLIPNQANPMWGVRLKPFAPEEHVDYVVNRELGSTRREAFLKLLRLR